MTPKQCFNCGHAVDHFEGLLCTCVPEDASAVKVQALSSCAAWTSRQKPVKLEVLAGTTIRVYLKSGQTFEYQVADGNKAREHCYAIWQSGYRANDGKVQTWYGPHWIDKIVVTPAPDTAYVDKAGGT